MPIEPIRGDNMAIGENLKRLRREKQLNQGELSKLTGIELNHISKIENGKSDPKLSTIEKLIKGLGCSANSLLMDEETNLDSMMIACLERTQSLPERAKYVIIDLIDHYCMSYAFKELLSKDSGWPMRNASVVTGATKSLIRELPDITKLDD